MASLVALSAANMRALRRAGVKATGTAGSARARRRTTMMRVKGVRVAFLSYTAVSNVQAVPHPWSLNWATPGAVVLNGDGVLWRLALDDGRLEQLDLPGLDHHRAGRGPAGRDPGAAREGDPGLPGPPGRQADRHRLRRALSCLRRIDLRHRHDSGDRRRPDELAPGQPGASSRGLFYEALDGATPPLAPPPCGRGARGGAV